MKMNCASIWTSKGGISNNCTYNFLILKCRFILTQFFKKDHQTYTLKEIRETGGLIAVEKDRPQVGMILKFL